MTKDEALRLALEALEYTGLKWPQVEEAITAIKASLLSRSDGEAKDEPVAWIEHHKGGDNLVWDDPSWKRTPLYTTPPQRKPLTDEEIVETFCKAPHQTQHVAWFAAGVRYAEAAHGIKGEA